MVISNGNALQCITIFKVMCNEEFIITCNVNLINYK